MRTNIAVINTDQRNRQNLVMPVYGLTESIEGHVAACARRGLPIGMPMNIAHDVHRPCGWAVSQSIHMGPDLARQLGSIHSPESDEERQGLAALRIGYWRHHDKDGVEPFAAELTQRLSPADLSGVRWIAAGGPAFVRAGLAAELYPELFTAGVGIVDKDGLANYAALRARMKEVHWGIFHDAERDVLLFAHRFFRRSLSHDNALNDYVLSAFGEVAAQHPGLNARLRLDPDIVGHAGAFLRNIELEYWRGPHFNDDIASIPNGVAEHKADTSQRFYGGVDKTQIWWKGPDERRTEAGGVQTYRSFEVEELIEDPSPGLERQAFGCRYGHAEFNIETGFISHFDGAIRAYDGDAYLQRIDVSIDHAGKQAHYTKLFRLDGDLPVQAWKRLLCAYFRGNELIPEYLGEEPDSDDPGLSGSIDEDPPGPPVAPALAALLHIDLKDEPKTPGLIGGLATFSGGGQAPYVEVGAGAVAELLRSRVGQTLEAAVDDHILNLAAIDLGESQEAAAQWPSLARSLADALEIDAAAHSVTKVSLAYCWAHEAFTVALSIAGNVEPMIALLRDAAHLVSPQALPSTWIENFNQALREHAPKPNAPSDWLAGDPFSGRLSIPRTGDVNVRFLLPESFIPGLDSTALSHSFSGEISGEE